MDKNNHENDFNFNFYLLEYMKYELLPIKNTSKISKNENSMSTN